MRQIYKRVSSVCTALLCAAVLMVSGAVMVWADEEINDTVKQQLTMTAESLTNAIIPLTEEEIDSYMKGGDAFTEGAMTSWSSAKEELGELKETSDSEIVYSDGQYTVTVPAEFEKADANFVYVFDETGTPTSMTVDVQYPMSETLKRAGLNTVMGLGTVFIMLIFLSFIIYLFRFIPGLVEGKKKNAPAQAAPVAPVQAATAVEEEPADDTELIAVIAAAIAAAEGTTTDGFVVRSIRKVNRKKW